MRQNAPATTHVPKPIIVNQSAYRAAVRRRVERYGLVPAEWHAPVVRLVCRAATHSWHAMRPIVEPAPGDPDWVALRLREGRLVWRLGVDRTCVAWPVRATCRTVAELLRASGDHDPKVRALADRALASARHGDVAAVLHVEQELGELRQRAELDADLDRPLCPAATVVVGPTFAPGRMGQLIWRRCTTLRAIASLGTALDNCLAHVNRSHDGPCRAEALAGHEHLWGLYDGGTAVTAARSVRGPVWLMLEVRGPRNADVEPRYHAAIATLWSWHAAHEAGPHAPDWGLSELVPAFLEGPNGTRTEMLHADERPEGLTEQQLRRALRRTIRRHDPNDMIPRRLRDTPEVRQALRSYVDPARDWALDPPRLGELPAADGAGCADDDLSLAA